MLELVAWVSRVYAAGPLALFLFSGKAFLSFSKFGVCGGLTSSDLCVCFPVVLLGFARFLHVFAFVGCGLYYIALSSPCTAVFARFPPDRPLIACVGKKEKKRKKEEKNKNGARGAKAQGCQKEKTLYEISSKFKSEQKSVKRIKNNDFFCNFAKKCEKK